MNRMCLVNLLFIVVALVAFPLTSQADLLDNPGFETGDFTGWEKSADIVNSWGDAWIWEDSGDHLGDIHSGTYCVGAGMGGGNPEGTVSVWQDVNIKCKCQDGDVLTFSAWTKGDGDFASGGTAWLELEFKDSELNVIKTYKSRTRDGVYDYVKDELSCPVPEGAVYVTAVFVVHSFGGSVGMDDASLTVNSKPWI